jgi:hypothetical protein
MCEGTSECRPLDWVNQTVSKLTLVVYSPAEYLLSGSSACDNAGVPNSGGYCTSSSSHLVTGLTGIIVTPALDTVVIKDHTYVILTGRDRDCIRDSSNLGGYSGTCHSIAAYC